MKHDRADFTNHHTQGIRIVLTFMILVILISMWACGTAEGALADKANFTNDNTEYRRKFDVAFDEDEKPIRYGFHYIVSKVTEGFRVRIFHPDKKVLTEVRTYSTEAMTLLHGPYHAWWDDGSIRYQGTYRYGRKHGLWLESEAGKGKSSSGDFVNHRKEGQWTQLDTNGMVESVYAWHDDKLHGKFFLYNEEGEKINEGLYKNDTLITTLFKRPERQEAILQSCQDHPFLEPNACTQNFLLQLFSVNLRYPAVARKHGIEGDVLIQWDILANGNVSNIRIPQALSDEIEAECRRVLSSMPAWNPARLDGKPVKSTYSLPLRFRA